MPVERYSSAKSLFQACYDARMEYDRTVSIMERLKAADELHAVRYDRDKTSGGAVTDGRDATAARLDAQAMFAKRMEEDLALLAEGTAVCYGVDGHGGVRSILGGATADALYLRYCMAAKWDALAPMLGKTVRWCAAACSLAFDTIDAYGIEAVKAGEGIAE